MLVIIKINGFSEKEGDKVINISKFSEICETSEERKTAKLLITIQINP